MEKKLQTLDEKIEELYNRAKAEEEQILRQATKLNKAVENDLTDTGEEK